MKPLCLLLILILLLLYISRFARTIRKTRSNSYKDYAQRMQMAITKRNKGMRADL